MVSNTSPVLDLKTMARELRVPANWLRAQAVAGVVPAIAAGSRWLFNPVAVKAALAARAAHPADYLHGVAEPLQIRAVPESFQ